MTVVDLSNPEALAAAVIDGTIWHAPTMSIRQALVEVGKGNIPPPASVPPEWRPFYQSVAPNYPIDGSEQASGPV